MKIFRKQNLDELLKNNSKHPKEKTLNIFDLTLMSVGAVIGTGVMVLTGVMAAKDAGPSIAISFLVSAITCILIVLCYAEFSSSVPSAGSSYSYMYVSLGEIVAYVVGMNISLGYILSIGTVAGGWSAYLCQLLASMGINLPISLTKIPSQGGIIDLPAILVILFILSVLLMGTRESKKVNNFMVLVKISVILLFVIVGAFFIHTKNWHPFAPFGVSGVFAGASGVFFAYTGFDTTTSAAEEVKNPQRTLPLGLILSLLISAIIYIIVSLVLTGITKYTNLNVADSLSYALDLVNQKFVASVISVGAVIGIMAVIFADAFGTSRILMTMSNDKLLPKSLSKLNSKFAPKSALIFISIISATLAGFVDLSELANLANACLIFAYFLVCLGILFFRKNNPNAKRGFKTPFVPILPIIAMIFCAFLLFNLPASTWIYFSILVVLVLIFYFAYSFKHSAMSTK